MTSKVKSKQEYVDRMKTTVGCNKCGKQEPSERLHFHHVEGKTKIDAVSRMVDGGCSLEKVKNEIRKCEVLCNECHAAHHYGRSKQDCIDAIQEVAEELGKSPSCSEYEEHSEDNHPSSFTIQKKFDSWNDAKESAELSVFEHDEGNHVYTKQDCIDAIQEVAETLGKSPSKKEYGEHSKNNHPSEGTIYEKFDSWNEAKEAAGLTIFTSAGKAASVETERQTSFNQF